MLGMQGRPDKELVLLECRFQKGQGSDEQNTRNYYRAKVLPKQSRTQQEKGAAGNTSN